MDPWWALCVVETILPSCVLVDAELLRHPLNRVAESAAVSVLKEGSTSKRIFEENPYVGLQS